MLYTQACKIFEVNFGRTIRRRWPVVAPVNASCRTTHDSGTVWFAIPFNSTQFFLSLCASAVGRQSIFSVLRCFLWVVWELVLGRDSRCELAGSVVSGGSEVDEVFKSPSHSFCWLDYTVYGLDCCGGQLSVEVS